MNKGQLGERVRKLQRMAKRGANKHGQLALAVFAGITAIGAVVTAIKASPKAEEIKEHRNEELELLDEEYEFDEMNKKEYDKRKWDINWQATKEFACTYAMTAALLGISLGCTAGGYRVSLGKQAALIGAYKMLESKSENKINRLKEVIGEKKFDEAERKTVENSLKEAGPVPENCRRRDMLMEGSGNNDLNDPTLLDYPCWDEWSGRYFKSTRTKIETALVEASRGVVNEMFVPMNTIYDKLGMTMSASGADYGFSEHNTERGKIPCKFYTIEDETYGPILVMSLKPEPEVIY